MSIYILRDKHGDIMGVYRTIDAVLNRVNRKMDGGLSWGIAHIAKEALEQPLKTREYTFRTDEKKIVCIASAFGENNDAAPPVIMESRNIE